MKASERWLQEKLLDAHPQFWDGLRHQFAHEVARIDAAEARLYMCQVNSSLRAQAHIAVWRGEWAQCPERWEALADVAEGIDSRERGEPEPLDTIELSNLGRELLELAFSAKVRRERIDHLGFKHDQLTTGELDDLFAKADQVAEHLAYEHDATLDEIVECAKGAKAEGDE